MRSIAGMLTLLALGATVAEAQYNLPGKVKILGKSSTPIGRIAFVKVRCAKPAGDTCKVKVSLTYQGDKAGKGKVTLDGAKAGKAAVRLGADVFAELNAAGKLKMTATATGRSGGKALTSAEKTFTVKSACEDGVCPR